MQTYIIIVKHMLILISISLCTKFKVLTQNFKIYYISVSNVFLVCKVLYKCIYLLFKHLIYRIEFKICYISVSNVFLVCKVLYKCIKMHIFTI
jgi:hypothetical protein